MHDYSQFRDAPADNILARLADLAMQQRKAEEKVAKLEEELKQAQGELAELRDRQIPAVMDEAGCSEAVTRDGLRVKVLEKIRGSIPEATAAQAFAWLADHNHDNLIKRKFEIEFGKDEEAWARKFERDLAKRKNPLKVNIKRTVHPSTLCSFISEQLSNGVDIPLDIFGAYRQRSAKIETK